MKWFVSGACAAFAFALAASSTSAATPPPPKADVWRPLDLTNTLVIDTNKGRIVVELYPKVAPDTVARIEQLTRQHFYDGLTFFRVIDDFMDQTGDPQNSGAGGSNLPNVKPEFDFKYGPAGSPPVLAHLSSVDLLFFGALPVLSQSQAMADLTADGTVVASPMFCSGVIGMARAEAPGSANSQFFLMRADHLALDERYAAFGRVVQGEAVVRAIKIGEPVAPPQDKMNQVRMADDLPPDQRPNLHIADTGSPGFKARVLAAQKSHGDDFNPCAVDVPVQEGP
ncbi:MAG TPA: peptidylprolyl isomerase [Caulobacteraceae bacterium]|nr:peptidylprolyl isomerase [Caulobacteraceae bacterium]